jgi:hypothetical protein
MSAPVPHLFDNALATPESSGIARPWKIGSVRMTAAPRVNGSDPQATRVPALTFRSRPFFWHTGCACDVHARCMTRTS